MSHPKKKIAKPDLVREVTDNILALLDKGVIPWQQGWACQWPRNLITKKTYRGINVFFLSLEAREHPFWCTKKQAEAHGGAIKEPEVSKPKLVVFWHPASTRGIPLPGGVMLKNFRHFVKAYDVYNVEQTTGLDRYVPDDYQREFVPVEKAEQIALGMAQRPPVNHGSDGAYYNPLEDDIHMPSRQHFMSPEKYYGTLFHELVHSTGHKSRLNRPSLQEVPTSRRDHNYSFEELVAEMGSAMLCGLSGLRPKTIDDSAAYISSWLDRLQRNRKILLQAASMGQKAFDFIVDDITDYL